MRGADADRPSPGSDVCYGFAAWTFDPVTGELRSDGLKPRRLAPQPTRVLIRLLQTPRELVTRRALKSDLWPATVADADKNLNFCVREVRAALGDDAGSPSFVETLPRRGYRFISDVHLIPREEVSTVPDEAASPRGRSWSRGAVASVLLMGAVASGLVATGVLDRDAGPSGSHLVALEALEMGGYLLGTGDRADVERSVAFFQEALTRDPTLAPAHAALGTAYLRLSRAEAGKASLERSLELDPGQWPSHLRLGMYALSSEHDFEAGVEHLLQARKIAPDQASALHALAWAHTAAGDLDGAMSLLRAALSIDPVSPRVNGDAGRIFHLAGRTEEAVAYCRRTIRLLPDRPEPRDCIVHTLAEAGSLAEARAVAVGAMEHFEAPRDMVASVQAGTPEQALIAYWRWMGSVLEGPGAGDTKVLAAASWARSGDADRAFSALDDAYRSRSLLLLQMHLDPAIRRLAHDRRYEALLGRIGLPLSPAVMRRLMGH